MRLFVSYLPNSEPKIQKTLLEKHTARCIYKSELFLVPNLKNEPIYTILMELNAQILHSLAWIQMTSCNQIGALTHI